MTGKKIGIGLIGAGGMGKRWAAVISKSKKATLEIIVDAQENKAKELASNFQNCVSSNDIFDVLKSPNIQVVVIAVPHKYLAPLSKKFLERGKHVLCEKPGGINPEQIKGNIDLARRKKLTYMVGFNHRFHDAFLKARKFFDRGNIGKLLFIRARYGFGGRKNYNKEWRLAQKISGGGELIDQGVHMIDLALSFMGKDNQARGFIKDTFWKAGVEDNAFVILKGKTAIASIHVSLTQWKPMHNFEIYGTTGYLSIEGLGKKYGGSERLTVGRRSDDFSSPAKERIILCNSDADKSLALELNEFLFSIDKRRLPIPSGKDAYETLKIVENIYKDNKL